MLWPIFTSGYEGLVQDQLLDRLVAAEVKTLLDVRAIAQSRKAGFSKTLLGSSAASRGVTYAHLRALGTPKAGRIAARAGRAAEMGAIFAAHMTTEAARRALAEAVTLASSAPTCLLCFERDPHMCHRRIVAEAIASATGQAIRHL
jgi:uncharacterized protein (DUF488 family)